MMLAASCSCELMKPKIATALASCILLRAQSQLTLVRAYGSSSHYTTSRESRFMKKLITGSSKSKKKWYHYDQPHSKSLKEFNFFAASTKADPKADLPKFVTGATEPESARVPSGRVVRRVSVLNTVFLQHITSILATGELAGSADIMGMGLEISYVHVMPDFKLVNVYWFTTGSEEKEAYLEQALKALGPKLRHALITLRVMGVVPPIYFVKDTKQSQLTEVERLFETADYGENFVPTKGANLFRPPPTTISKEVADQIEMLERSESSQNGNQSLTGKDSETEGEDGTAPPPEPKYKLDPQYMRHDMLGLKRDRIMDGIADLIAKRKMRQKKEAGESSVTDTKQTNETLSPEELIISAQNQTARTEMFVKYLKLKQMEASKVDKLESTAAYERKFYNSLRIERGLEEMERHALETEQKLYSKNYDKELDEDYWSESDSDSEYEDKREK